MKMSIITLFATVAITLAACSAPMTPGVAEYTARVAHPTSAVTGVNWVQAAAAAMAKAPGKDVTNVDVIRSEISACGNEIRRHHFRGQLVAKSQFSNNAMLVVTPEGCQLEQTHRLSYDKPKVIINNQYIGNNRCALTFEDRSRTVVECTQPPATVAVFRGYQCPQGYIVDVPANCNKEVPEVVAIDTYKVCPDGTVATGSLTCAIGGGKEAII